MQRQQNRFVYSNGRKNLRANKISSQFKRRVTEKKARILGYDARYLHFPVVRATSGKVALVCFHGWLDNAASFVPLAEELGDFEIYAWDFLGHGKSDHKHAGERYHYIDLVAFIDAALAHIPAERIILLGHSMGAGACALYAGTAQKKLTKVILIEGFSPMTADPADAAKILSDGLADLKKAEKLTKPVYKKFAEALAVRVRINGLTEQTALPLVRRATVKVKGGYTWRADFRLRASSLVRMTFAQVENILGKISVPVLVILGEKGMPELRRVAEQKQRLFQKGALKILPGHHHLHMDHSAEVATEIRAFIKE